MISSIVPVNHVSGTRFEAEQGGSRRKDDLMSVAFERAMGGRTFKATIGAESL